MTDRQALTEAPEVEACLPSDRLRLSFGHDPLCSCDGAHDTEGGDAEGFASDSPVGVPAAPAVGQVAGRVEQVGDESTIQVDCLVYAALQISNRHDRVSLAGWDSTAGLLKTAGPFSSLPGRITQHHPMKPCT